MTFPVRKRDKTRTWIISAFQVKREMIWTSVRLHAGSQRGLALRSGTRVSSYLPKLIGFFWSSGSEA